MGAKELTSVLFLYSSGEGLSTASSTSKRSDSGSPAHSSTSSGLHSPKEAVQVPEEGTKLPEDSKTGLSSLPSSPVSDSLHSIPETSADVDGASLTKMGMYSPSSSQEQFSVPENLGNEAQTSPSLPPAASDPQPAAFFSDSEFPTKSDQSLSISRTYPYPPISMTPLMSPSGYTAGATYSATYTGSTETMMPSYPTTISPSYMSPYGTKQYTWPNPSNGYGTYAPELLQAGGYTYQPSTLTAAATYSAMSRPTYPTPGYFLPQLATTTSQSC